VTFVLLVSRLSGLVTPLVFLAQLLLAPDRHAFDVAVQQ